MSYPSQDQASAAAPYTGAADARARAVRADRARLEASLAVLAAVLIAVVALTLSASAAAWRRSAWVSQVAEPARKATQEVEAALLARMQGVEGLRATGDTAYSDQIHAAMGRERAAVARLFAAADQVHPGMRGAVRVLELALDTAWLRAGGGPPGSRGWMQEFHAYRQAVAAAQAVEDIVANETADRRERITSLEGRAGAGALMMVPVALLCLWIALRCVMRLRVAAGQAEDGRAELERLSREKAALVYDVTRYLRQPLGTVAGRLATFEVGAGSAVDGPMRAALAGASSELRRALQILNDLAELSTADAGTMPIRLSRVNLAALLDGTTSGLMGWASAKGVRLSHAPPPTEVDLVTDVERLRGILRNLLSSAIELASQGAVIQIESSLHSNSPDGRGGPWIAIVISESRLLDRTAGRVSSTELLLRTVGPTGELGLTLSQRVAALLGGELSAHGGGAGGTRFALWLPAGPTPYPAEFAEAAVMPAVYLEI
jgi:signal transduction histidine kinase